MELESLHLRADCMEDHELGAHLDECPVREKVHEAEARLKPPADTAEEIEEIRSRFS